MSLSFLEISKEALLHNISQFRALLPKDGRLVGVVKANAYGHGLKEIIAIAENEADAFQVDDIDELRELRTYTKKPAFVFGYVLQDDLEELAELDGVLGVCNKETLRILNGIGAKRNKKVPIHLKVDALIGRQGILAGEADDWIALLKRSPYVALESVYSHFSNIEDTDDLSHARLQHQELLKVKKMFADAGLDVAHHISATSGLMSDEGNWGGSLVRLGIGMYGLWPSESLRKRLSHSLELRPVLSWKTHVAQIKSLPAGYPVGYGIAYRTKEASTVAVIPQGYSDGFDRGLSNNGEVLIRGKRCKVLGRVAMNMFVADVSGVGASLEDEAVIIGDQDREAITADDLASSLGTINYEIVARLSPLLPRRAV